MKLFQLISAFVVLWSFNLRADIPPGYYDKIDGKKERNLKTSLSGILVNHTRLRYDDLWFYFKTTDRRPDGYVWDMYSNQNREFNGDKAVSGMNKEHSLPKSWWATSGNVEKYDAYSDLNHLYPSDGSANTAKSNYMLGTVGSYTFYNGVSKVGSNNYSGGPTHRAFEPADEYKGDFARTYFYMLTCYEHYADQWRSDGLNMLDNNTYPVLKEWAKKMLLEWHRKDPVSTKELDRNEEVFRYQGNRNPFIDFPELAEHIWGNLVDDVFLLPGDLEPKEPVLITPVNNTDLYFGELKPGESQSISVKVKGTGLKGDLSLFLHGGDRNLFALSASEVSANIVNSDEGYDLQVFYHPLEYGEHTSTLTVYDGGLEGTIAVHLHGTCSPTSGIEIPIGAQSPDWYVRGRVIEFRTYQPGSAFVLYNMQGQLIHSGTGDGNWQQYTCPAPGIYLLRINGKTVKIVVNRL